MEREQRSEEMKVKDPRTEEESAHSSDLLNLVLVSTHSTHTYTHTEVHTNVHVLMYLINTLRTFSLVFTVTDISGHNDLKTYIIV